MNSNWLIPVNILADYGGFGNRSGCQIRCPVCGSETTSFWHFRRDVARNVSAASIYDLRVLRAVGKNV